MSSSRDIDAAIARVVANANCSGCGACCLIDAGLEMHVDRDGYSRPERRRAAPDTRQRQTDAERFRKVCPGETVVSPASPGAARHSTMGQYLRVWESWASDPTIRFRGSSGGALTALITWLVETGESHRVVGAQSDATSPRRTVSVEITSRDAAFAAAGSRYAPVSIAANPATWDSTTVGKPCEIAALRALHADAGIEDAPLLLSFFCAGTPSQRATDELVQTLGFAESDPIEHLWYRGRGWPGSFTVVGGDGRIADVSYDESWGRHLGPRTQWRCKICPDGVGESSDVTAADFWTVDARGYPDFSEGAGSSALIARTARGLDVVQRAAAAGVLEIKAIEMDALARVQPLQRARRSTLAGRLAGTRLAGRRIPRYRGFDLLKLSWRGRRETLRTVRGSYLRVRRSRAGKP